MAFHCIRCKAEIDRDYKACPHCGEPVTDFLRRYADEPVDGKYQILERLGAGGMGDVYKVSHTYLGATRVIKVIRPQISESQDAHDRFLREARAATKVQHPNVATLHDFSALPDGSHYMVWEFIDGENLAQRIHARGSLPPRYAVQLAIQALSGLEAIHRAGIVHRDISPENLMITREAGGEERVKIIDMGVAKVEDSGDASTLAGVFVGKLRYASPEHLGFLAKGERIDGRADLYSMGVVLYEMLTGRPPFEATSPHEYVLLHSRDAQFKPMNLPADLPGGSQLQAVLSRALERDRNKRFASAREFANALEQVERTLPDASAMQTVAGPLSQQSTIRSGFGDAPTVRTPLPGDSTAAATTIVAREETTNTGAFLVVGVILLIAGAAIAFLLLRKSAEPEGAPPKSKLAASAQQPPPPMKPQARVEVVSPAPVTTTTAATTSSAPPPQQPTATVATATATVATATVAPAPKKKPVIEKPREPEPTPSPTAAAPPVRTFVDGEGGDSGVNDQALSEARRHLRGVTRVAVHANNAEMLKDLTDQLKRQGLTVSDGADTVVNFDGTLERLGRGKKRRAAQVTVSRNGRMVFRYELPAEEYRVGDTPAEAFSRVFSDITH